MTPNAKDKIQYSTAAFMLLSGVVLTYCSFFMKGDVLDSVLWYAGQTMVYAGSIFGVSVLIRTKSGELRNYIDERIREEKEAAS